MADDFEPGRDDECVPDDDAVIGRVFRRSLVAIAVISGLVGAAVYLSRRPEAVLRVEEANLALPRAQQRVADAPEVRFTDVTLEAGVSFVHENGARGEKLLPESMGSGAAFFDYDGDEDPDLLLINGDQWPADRADSNARPTLGLYRNDGHGHFEDVTSDVGLDVSQYGVGVAVGDYDADADIDIFVTTIGANRLFRNDDGRFQDVSQESGAAGSPDSWGTSTGFFDYDNDGDLDLFICNYIEWSPEIDRAIDFRITGIGRAYGPPRNFAGAHPSLLRNEGNGTFTDVSKSAGLHVMSRAGHAVAKALAISFVDIDLDGWMDVLVANDTVQNFFYHNRGDGTFEEIGYAAGVAFDANGAATGAMGIDVSHYRNDDGIGIAIGNFANEMTSLYVTQGNRLVFSDQAIVEGVGAKSRSMLTFGLFFFDYDLDGRLDLLQANGHLEEAINVTQPSQHYRQPAQLFWNSGPDGPQAFTPIDAERTGDLAAPIVGRGATYADIDGDGDLDVLLTQVAGRPLLLRNDQNLGHHWLRVRLEGRGANRAAIGARVELVSVGIVQRRQVMPTRSYLSQVELPVTFGLGDAQVVDRLTIHWPNGGTQGLENIQANQHLVVRQGEG
jgi:hypothetical protein